MTSSPAGGACMLCGSALVVTHRFGQRAIAYCRLCQLGRLTPMPTADELTSLYRSREYFEGTDAIGYADYVPNASQYARTFRAKIDQLLRDASVHDLLEIGCGPGYFLREAQRAGVREVVGVDLNPWAIDEARRNGLEAYVGSSDALPQERKFDAVVMLDLLEHVTEPASFLESVRRRLRPGGTVFINTPNIRSTLARISGKQWVSFKIPEHVYFYSPRSIRRLLGLCGFEAISVRGSGQYVTVRFLLTRLARLAPRVTKVCDAAARALTLRERVIFSTNGSMDVIARMKDRT